MNKFSKKIKLILCLFYLGSMIFPLYSNTSICKNSNPTYTQKLYNDKNQEEGFIVITLTSGEQKRGKFLFENDESITIETEHGTETLKKLYILKTNPPLEHFRTKKKIKKGVPRRERSSRREKAKTSNFEIFVSGGFVGGQKVAETSYEDIWNTNYVDAIETGTISPDISTGAGFSAGFNYFFYRDLGISVSFNYNLKNKFDINADYNYTLTYFNNDTESFEGSWTSSGEISVMPITLNLIYALHISRNSIINIYGGMAIFLTDVNLSSNMGWGAIIEEETQEFIIFYRDWFDFEHEIKQNETIIGANAGINFEQKINDRFGIFVGFQYFFAPKKEYMWELITQPRYDGVLDTLYMEDTPEIQELVTEINFSFYKAFIGIKIHL